MSAIRQDLGRMPRGHLWGLTIANNATDSLNDIDIAVGEARDSTNAVDMVLSSALTKRLDAAWVVGTNQGGLDTGTIANNTYHVHLIKRTDGTVSDVLFSLSATAPTMPSGYTYFRRIGSIVRSSIGIWQFSQRGDEFLWKGPGFDVSVNNLGTTATLYAIAAPTGIQVIAKMFIDQYHATTGCTVYLSCPSVDDQPSVSIYNSFNDFAAGYAVFEAQIRTNTSAQIRARSELVNTWLDILTHGYVDDRGKSF